MTSITPRLLEDSDTFKAGFTAPKFTGPVTFDESIDVTTPSNPNVIGGFRLRSNTNGDALFQITNSLGTTEFFTLKFRNQLMVTSGLVTTLRALVDTKLDFLTSNAGAFITADAYWAAQSPFELVDADHVIVDFAKGINFKVKLEGNRTLDFPSNVKLGQRGYIRIQQDTPGGRLLAFASGYRFEDNVTAPLLNSAATSVTILRYEVTAVGEVSLYGGKGVTPVIIEATAQEYISATAGRVVSPDKVWAANQVVTISETDLTTGINFNNFINAVVTLTDNRMVVNPTGGMKPGQSGTITFIMGGIGGYSLSFGDKWWAVNSEVPALPPSVGSIHRMYYTITSTGTVDFFVGTNMGRTYDVETTLYFNAMSQQPNLSRKILINDFIKGLKTDGIWVLLDNLWLLASHDEQSSLINLITPSKTLTKYGTPFFVVDKGWQQTATSGASSSNKLICSGGFYDSAFKRNSRLNSCYGVWQNTSFSETQNGYLAGNHNNSFEDYIYYNNTATQARFAGRGTGSVATSPVKGMKAVTCVLGGNGYVFQNGTISSPFTLGAYSGTENIDTSFSLLNVGNNGSYNGTNNRQAAGFTGAGLTNVQMTALYNRLNTYLTAIGAN